MSFCNKISSVNVKYVGALNLDARNIHTVLSEQ